MGETPEAPAEGEPKAEDAPKDDPTPQSGGKTFDESYVKELRAEAARNRKEAQEAKAKAAEYEDRDKSETEKLTGKLSKAEERAQAAENKLLRFQVAAEKQLPKELIPRLRGDTQEELEADADELLSLVKSRTETNDPPDFDGGARESAEETDPVKAHNQAVLKAVGLAS